MAAGFRLLVDVLGFGFTDAVQRVVGGCPLTVVSEPPTLLALVARNVRVCR